MNRNIRLVLCCLLGVLPNKGIAEGWEGGAEFGLIKTSGNSESESISFGLDLAHVKGKWTNSFLLDFYRLSNDGVESANSVSADYVLEFSLNERHNLFASIGYLDDDFDGFTEKRSAALGYGYKVIDSESTQWETSFGVGYRDADILVPIDSPPPSDGASVQSGSLSINGTTFVARSDFETSLTENTQFVDTFKSEIGSDNSFYENEAALVVEMNDRFSLKVGFLIRHNTDPGLESEKSDTISTLSLVYSLGE